MFTSRSRNSYMRVLRSVTLTPSGMFSRTLKPAIDLRACVITGFWPAMRSRSAAAARTFLESATASPTPMFSTILSSFGVCMTFLYPNCSVSPLRISPSYWVRRRGMYAVSAIDQFSGSLSDARFDAVLDLEADARRPRLVRLRLRIDKRDVAQVDRRFLGEDAGILASGLLGVATHQVDALHQGAGLFGNDAQDLPGLALVLARQHDDLVALLDLGSHYSTSGASEMIFMWLRERSSRGTGPKMRVPIGSD